MEVAKKVKGFYERYPYPNQRVGKRDDLLSGEHNRIMKRLLATAGLKPEKLKGKNVLDAGCGTGEKALYCALCGANADAFDISEKSIEIAKRNAKRLGAKVNYSVAAFESVKLKKKYDLILCIGSLHHTADARGNFLRMAKCLRRGGKIVLGLYNLYGRFFCRLKRKFLFLSGPEQIREENPVWFSVVADRYYSPHETYHSLEEVLQWFEEAGVKPIASWPAVKLSSWIDMKVKQMEWLVKWRGFFFIGGRKK